MVWQRLGSASASVLLASFLASACSRSSSTDPIATAAASAPPAPSSQAAGDNAGAPPALEPIPKETPQRELASPRNDVAGAPNLAQISPELWRSAQPNAEGFKNLKALGIKTVVNLRNVSSDRDELKGLGLKYVHIHFAPWHPEEEDVVAFLKVLEDPENHPVLVHCQHGADRTGTMIAIYRAYQQGWPMKDAMQELPRFGFHSIWANLKKYLERLDVAALRAKVRAAPAPKAEVVP